MGENINQYQQRTRGFMMNSLKYNCAFETRPSLRQKVNDEGHFIPFYGDTIVFNLDNAIKNKALELQNVLYENNQNILADRIDPSTFHVTLHDLSNGNSRNELLSQMEQNKESSTKILEMVESEKLDPISLRTVSVFNMVNTSVVLGLEPANNRSCYRLMALHNRFQSVVRLDYPLTLHITLGYYKPGTYSPEQISQLNQTFMELNKTMGEEFFLDEKQLLYQRFDSMNHYF
ncbi:ligT like phosphoesterase [Histomonas meleagridis]|uniref:ligT like phosphoesterase n=1 Tax=Histomonas meleagridis TaxID=135588 RepID=UPI0035595C2D|nr:ligT like phosphoesterase [Histomonas meleagridis]KAH0797736.1 ligT like phosphoesterase [Histomonas meleagridis]